MRRETLLVSKIFLFAQYFSAIITRRQLMYLCGCGFLVRTRANKQKMGKHKHKGLDKSIDDEEEDIDITNTVSLLYVIFCFK